MAEFSWYDGDRHLVTVKDGTPTFNPDLRWWEISDLDLLLEEGTHPDWTTDLKKQFKPVLYQLQLDFSLPADSTKQSGTAVVSTSGQLFSWPNLQRQPLTTPLEGGTLTHLELLCMMSALVQSEYQPTEMLLHPDAYSVANLSEQQKKDLDWCYDVAGRTRFYYPESELEAQVQLALDHFREKGYLT